MTNRQPVNLKALEKQLRKQGRAERKSIVVRQAKTCIGPSTWRTLAAETNDDVAPALKQIDLKKLVACRKPAEFRKFFCEELKRVDRALARKNKTVKGRKWGYGTKILSLFLRGMVLHTRYFDYKVVERLTPLLYVPVDRIVLNNLRKAELDTRCRAIKDMSQETFWQIQEWLAEAASNVGVPSIIFDDVWSNQEQYKQKR